MTQPLDLDQIERRANATPGPWALHDALDGDGYPGHLWVVETPDGTPGDNAVVISIGDKATGEFIAASRTDIPNLIGEVRRLRAELAERRDQVLTEGAELIQADAEAKYQRSYSDNRIFEFNGGKRARDVLLAARTTATQES